MRAKLLILGLLFLFSSCKAQDYIAWIQPPMEPPADTFCVEYGLLYNWYAASDERNITSSDDWVLPTPAQWADLMLYIEPSSTSLSNTVGGRLKETGTAYWDSPNTGATNEYGFNARGTGSRRFNTGGFSYQKRESHFWNNQPSGSYARISVVKYDSDIFSTSLFPNAFNDERREGNCIRLLYVGENNPTTYTGNDGTVYRVVQIGTQYWLADNLIETKFRDGSIIPFHGTDNDTAFTNAEWAALSTAGVCAFNNDVNYVGCDFAWNNEGDLFNYEAKYNWYAVANESPIANTGWHVITKSEIESLKTLASNSGGAMKDTSLLYWDSPNAYATNVYSFNARGSGYRYINGTDLSIKSSVFIWTSDEYVSDTSRAYYFAFAYNNDNFNVSSISKKTGCSIRLVKDSTTLSDGETGVYVGNNGVVYETICINGIEVTSRSIVETKYRDGTDIPFYNGNDATWGVLSTGAMGIVYDNYNFW